MKSVLKFIVLLCALATIVICQEPPKKEEGGSLDDLINQIFTQDNSGIGIPDGIPTDNNNNNINNNNQNSTPPTPVIEEGGKPLPSLPPVSSGGPEHESTPIQTNTGVNPCTVGDCVPYYQCANGTIIVDGNGLLDIRLGEENNQNEIHPCQGLFETCCTLRSLKPLIPPETKINVGCGIRNNDGVGFRITGDKDNESQFGEFPWTVAVLKEEKALDGQNLNVYVCGGSLITPDVVLTAAHCVDQKDPHTLKIRAGEWDTQTKDEIFPHQDRPVRDFVVHAEYYKGGLFNDVALLFLDEPVMIVENVNTVCLPAPNEVFDGRCFASGWGKDLFGKEGKYQVILKRVELPIVPHAPCEEKLRKTRLGHHFSLHHSFICAGGERGRDTCKGDGGSPLVCPIHNAPGRYAQVGIVAWGIGCGDETPGVYVNIPMFRNWIDEQIQLKKLPSSSYLL